MIQIMANENMQDWHLLTMVINETVLSAKGYLDGELRKYGDWKELPSNLKAIIKEEGKNPIQSLAAAKRPNGVGGSIILKFLGEGVTSPGGDHDHYREHQIMGLTTNPRSRPGRARRPPSEWVP
jgi:hypothetical protein